MTDVSYHASLARAVAQLQPGSAAARQAVYARARESLERHLGRARPRVARHLVAAERAALEAAIRAIERGSAATDIRSQRALPAKAPSDDGDGERAELEPRRRVFGRAVGGLLIAALICGAGLAAYLAMGGRMPSLVQLAEQMRDLVLPAGDGEKVPAAAPPATSGPAASPPAQRAALYVEDVAAAAGRSFDGRAFWRARVEVTPAQRPQTVASIDVEIPGRQLLLALTIRREASAAISHLVELRFTGPGGRPLESVAGVAGLLMKREERAAGIELAGRVAAVTPGVFLLGLSAADADLQRNLALLQERDWLDVAIVHKDRSRSILAIEKGAEGRRVVREVLESWMRERPQAGQ